MLYFGLKPNGTPGSKDMQFFDFLNNEKTWFHHLFKPIIQNQY